MVRVNIIHPKSLADQHLIAEYLEIMMLVGYTREHPSLEEIPQTYRLGKGHIKFFKNKLKYLERRHKLIRKEMNRRGFATNKKINLKGFSKNFINDWKPKEQDLKIIKKRIKEKISMKPEFYRYNGEYKNKDFFIGILEKFDSPKNIKTDK